MRMVVAIDANTPRDKMAMVMSLTRGASCTWRSSRIGVSAVARSVKMLVAETKYETLRITVWPEVQSPGSPQAADTGLHWKMATGHEICQVIQARANNPQRMYLYFFLLARRIMVMMILDLIRAPSRT